LTDYVKQLDILLGQKAAAIASLRGKKWRLGCLFTWHCSGRVTWHMSRLLWCTKNV